LLSNIRIDTFVLILDVVGGLHVSGLYIKGIPTSRRELVAEQHSLNECHDELILRYSHLNRVTEYSIG